MKIQSTITYQKLYNIYRKYQLRYNKSCKSGQICLMWSTRRLPDVLTETKQILDIEKAFAIELDEDEAIKLYDMTMNEAVLFIEKKMKQTKMITNHSIRPGISVARLWQSFVAGRLTSSVRHKK